MLMLWRCFVLGFYECMCVCAWCLELLVPFFVIVYTCVGRGKGHLCAMMFAACSGRSCWCSYVVSLCMHVLEGGRGTYMR